MGSLFLQTYPCLPPPFREVVLTFNVSINCEEFVSLCCNTKINTPLMYEVVDNDTLKSGILPPSDSRKALLCLKKATRQKAFKAFFTSQKTSSRWQITSAFACCFLRWAGAVCLVTARVGGCKRTCFPFRCLCKVLRKSSQDGCKRTYFLCHCPCACMR